MRIPDEVAGHAQGLRRARGRGGAHRDRPPAHLSQERLEPHMVPTKFAFLPALPRSPGHGKVDESALA